jgi:adenylate cyclase
MRRPLPRTRNLAINPNIADNYALMAYVLYQVGRDEEVIPNMKKAMRLSPYYKAWYLQVLGISYWIVGRYEEALDTFKRFMERQRKDEKPLLSAHLMLAPTYIMLGQEEKARAHATEVLKLNPKFSLDSIRKASRRKAPVEKWYEAARKAGLPE